MSTVKKDQDGNVLEEIPGTQYHPAGTGPREADGTPILPPGAAKPARAPAAPAPAAGKTKGN